MKIYIFTTLSLIFLSVPELVFAEAKLQVKLNNPLKVNNIPELLVAILEVVIVVLTPIVVIFIVLAGFKYVTARGNAQITAEANRALSYAIVGGVIILGAVVITKIIEKVVAAF